MERPVAFNASANGRKMNRRRLEVITENPPEQQASVTPC